MITAGPDDDRYPVPGPATERLADCLDDLPATRDHFERLGDILAQLRVASVKLVPQGYCNIRPPFGKLPVPFGGVVGG